MTTYQRYEELIRRLQHQADVASALALLEWDQETFLPPGAQASRTRQIGALSAILHEMRTAPAFLDLVDDLATRTGDLTPEQATDVRETKWQLDRKRALEPALVRERSMLNADARAAWITAREKDDFAALAPFLERIVAMERRVARSIDASRPPYEVLLEEYEPGASLTAVERLFAELRGGLLPLVEQLRILPPERTSAAALRGSFPVDRQRSLNRRVAAAIGFDFSRGRLDEAVHPFSTTIGEDVRLTTRYDESDLRYALYSTIHEAGHGMYEQGLDQAAFGTPRGSACSLGVHESQSRLWENQVGRSTAFWRYLLPLARREYPDLASRSLEEVVLAANEARPSLIRTEADEITYNLHIILRFELERSLIDETIHVSDLPSAWREKMRAYLGVTPESDREGVLQDVHWASGTVGYFPTYTLGNVYAAQLARAAESALGPIDELVAAGEFRVLLGWLRENVHRHGQTYRSTRLIERATGSPPNVAPLLDHLRRKLAEIRGAQD